GRAVTLGMRPEDIQFAPRRQDGVSLPMQVVLVEPLGNTCLVTLRHRGWQAVALADAAFSRRSVMPKGVEHVDVTLNMEQAHLFDRSTGLALGNSRPAG